MSERRVLVDDTNERNGKASCPASRNNVLDGVSYFALGFVLAGLIFAAVGFLYPRDLVRDPNASARENEAVDIEYMQLTNALNAVVITGQYESKVSF
nr:hypothetical protein BaRGS_009064 [Batillaria attramentaria]